MNGIKFYDHTIGKNFPPFIIAEAGINHNGEIEKAFEMIKVAKNSGVNAIKFQTFRAKEFILDETLMHTYFSQGKKITEPQIKLFERCEFTRDEWFKIKEKCDEEKIMFLSTPENRSDLDLLLELGIPAIKIGSDEIINLPILKDFASTNLPILLSTGMATQNEINDALKTIGTLDGYPTVLFIATSQYPTPIEDVNLRKFETLKKLYPDIPLGFSDHTEGPLASSLACVLGAVCFEKHFTLSHDLPGPDHWFSEDISGLKIWVNSIKNSYQMLGSEKIEPTIKEKNKKDDARRSVVALTDIEQDEMFAENNLGFRRPGNGLPPQNIIKFLGKKAKNKISKGTMVSLNDIKSN